MNTREGRERMEMLQTDLIRRKAQLYEMENILPKQNGTYLKIILGNCNVSILDKSDKFRYKNEYEKFKLVMSLIALAVSLFNSLTNYRTMDIIHMFLLVWYYCTLTIRESILKVSLLANHLALSQSKICRPPPLTFDQPFMDDGECVI